MRMFNVFRAAAGLEEESLGLVVDVGLIIAD